VLRLTREQVIDRLRARLLTLTDEDRSLCQAAKDMGIFCHGFAGIGASGLAENRPWLEEAAGHPLSADELEARANQWELARQIFHDVKLSCDVEAIDHAFCRGWLSFTDVELARYHEELLGEAVEVVGAARG